MVVAGLLIGNHGRQHAMSDATQFRLDNFWELVDEILNVILFFIIGIELLQISHSRWSLLTAVLSILIVLLTRAITVSIPMAVFKAKNKYPRFFTTILIWGGLRGGLAVALALSLPATKERDIVLTMTYAVVLFSIIIQGLTIKPFILASSKKIT